MYDVTMTCVAGNGVHGVHGQLPVKSGTWCC